MVSWKGREITLSRFNARLGRCLGKIRKKEEKYMEIGSLGFSGVENKKLSTFQKFKIILTDFALKIQAQPKIIFDLIPRYFPRTRNSAGVKSCEIVKISGGGVGVCK